MYNGVYYGRVGSQQVKAEVGQILASAGGDVGKEHSKKKAACQHEEICLHSKSEELDLIRAINHAKILYSCGFHLQESDQTHVFTPEDDVLLADWVAKIITAAPADVTATETGQSVKSAADVELNGATAGAKKLANGEFHLPGVKDEGVFTPLEEQKIGDWIAGVLSDTIAKLCSVSSADEPKKKAILQQMGDKDEYIFTPIEEQQIGDWITGILSDALEKLHSVPSSSRSEPKKNAVLENLLAKQQRLTAELGDLEMKQQQLRAALAAGSSEAGAGDVKLPTGCVPCDGRERRRYIAAAIAAKSAETEPEVELHGYLASEMTDVSSYKLVLDSAAAASSKKPAAAKPTAKPSKTKRLKRWAIRTFLCGGSIDKSEAEQEVKADAAVGAITE